LQAAARRDRLPLLDAARQVAVLNELPAKAAKTLTRFVASIDRLRERIHDPLGELVAQVLSETDYQAHLANSEHEEDRQRLANVEELISAARDFQVQLPAAGLDEFLEQTSLAGDTDDWERNASRVTLMTLHAAKGLEFPRVFVIAAEQNILPHERSLQEIPMLEEERRLLFVGMTRARQQLQISFVRRRDYRGTSRSAIPSIFVGEILPAGVDYRSPSARPVHRREQPAGSEESTGVPRASLPLDPNRDSIHLATAADLWRERETPPDQAEPSSAASSECCFRVGIIVRHPKYGLGKVIKLSGSGRTQTGTIQFFQPLHQKSFRLSASPLQQVAAD
jgi:DNA helicase-2/ATP-dependent DNA helicase PcrA